MAFKKMEKQKYPPRLWALVGFPGSGKSTFATQMRGPILPIDADQRFGEVLPLAEGDVYELSPLPADHTDPERIAALLAENMPDSDVGTVVVDSLTAIISPLVINAIFRQGREKNKVAVFKDKALAMRLLQDSISRWGCDVLWIYHLQHGRDGKAQNVISSTIPKTERARLLRSLNLQLEVVEGEDCRRGVKVIWARRGRSFPGAPVLWDDTGKWAGMPEKIEAAVYDGLSEAEQNAIEISAPTVFPNVEAAIDWGMEQGAFQALQHARNAYEKLKREHNPQNAEAMAALWVANVEQRLETGTDTVAETPAETEETAEVPTQPDDDIDDFFPREGATGVVDANTFWQAFYALKAQGKLPQAGKLKQAQEIAEAQQSGDWGSALGWLHTQVH
jgi:hypothetical protein